MSISLTNKLINLKSIRIIFLMDFFMGKNRVIHKQYNENSKILLTELGQKITDKVLCSYPDLFSIGLLMVLKKSGIEQTIRNIFDIYLPNSAGNYMHFEMTISILIERDLIKLED